MNICAYGCGRSFAGPDDLRPYGFGGAMVCFDCAYATPERKAEADRRINLALDAVSAGGASYVVEDGPPRSTGIGMSKPLSRQIAEACAAAFDPEYLNPQALVVDPTDDELTCLKLIGWQQDRAAWLCRDVEKGEVLVPSSRTLRIRSGMRRSNDDSRTGTPTIRDPYGRNVAFLLAYRSHQVVRMAVV